MSPASAPPMPPSPQMAPPQPPPPPPPPPEKPSRAASAEDKARAVKLKSRVEAAKHNAIIYHRAWRTNVEIRLGRQVTRYTEGVPVYNDIQSEINPDWSLTKTKTANLFSQVPPIYATHENKTYAMAVGPFVKALNYEKGEKRANIGAAMEEALNDAVNAAGIAAIDTGYAARFETKETFEADSVGGVPSSSIPQEAFAKILAGAKELGQDIPTRTVETPTDYKFYHKRISPIDLLWPVEFVGSNFDDGDWIGYRGRCSWSEAKSEFRLKDDQKDSVVGALIDHTVDATLRSDAKATDLAETEAVGYVVLYYWRYRMDPDEKSFKSIWKLVFVDGLKGDEPAIHEQWKGQQYDNQKRAYVGCCRFPVQVLTLTYVSDNAIPPSDSAAGRPQVNDLRRSRSQMFQSRERSIPLRWFDVNRIDPAIQDSLMRGIVQGMIPTNGDGSRSVGEIARASYPSENIAFDQAAKQDLQESWQVGADQAGTMAQGRRTGTEASIVQQNFSTRMGQERNKVTNFYLRCMEVLAGWMALYSDFPSLADDERAAMQQAWDSKHVLHDLVLKILPGSTVVTDPKVRIAELAEYLNLTAKSGFVNVKPVIEEMTELHGLDVAQVVVDPHPPIEEPNISYRFSGKDDIINPVVMALLVKKNQAPSAQEIEEAKKLLTIGAAPPAPDALAQQLGGSQPQAGPQQSGAPTAPGSPVGPPTTPPSHAPMPIEPAHPDWHPMEKVAKRTRDLRG